MCRYKSWKNHTFEAIWFEGFIFSNNLLASRNPMDPKDKNFRHFHLFKYTRNLPYFDGNLNAKLQAYKY